MQAIYFEAKGKYKEANDVLGKLLEDHPDSHFALKRLVRTLSTHQPSTLCTAAPCIQQHQGKQVPGCPFVQVAMEKTKGNLSKAIELLRTYVDTFMMDREAWEELAELYLQVCS